MEFTKRHPSNGGQRVLDLIPPAGGWGGAELDWKTSSSDRQQNCLLVWHVLSEVVCASNIHRKNHISPAISSKYTHYHICKHTKMYIQIDFKQSAPPNKDTLLNCQWIWGLATIQIKQISRNFFFVFLYSHNLSDILPFFLMFGRTKYC